AGVKLALARLGGPAKNDVQSRSKSSRNRLWKGRCRVSMMDSPFDLVVSGAIRHPRLPGQSPNWSRNFARRRADEATCPGSKGESSGLPGKVLVRPLGPRHRGSETTFKPQRKPPN